MDPKNTTEEPLLLAVSGDTVMYDGKQYEVVGHSMNAYIQLDAEGRRRRTLRHTLDAQLDDEGYTPNKPHPEF